MRWLHSQTVRDSSEALVFLVQPSVAQRPLMDPLVKLLAFVCVCLCVCVCVMCLHREILRWPFSEYTFVSGQVCSTCIVDGLPKTYCLLNRTILAVYITVSNGTVLEFVANCILLLTHQKHECCFNPAWLQLGYHSNCCIKGQKQPSRFGDVCIYRYYYKQFSTTS